MVDIGQDARPVSEKWTFQAECCELTSNESVACHSCGYERNLPTPIVGGDAIVSHGLPDHFPPAGARRRNSSKKLSRNVRCVGGFCLLASSSARIAAKRLPSGAKS